MENKMSIPDLDIEIGSEFKSPLPGKPDKSRGSMQIGIIGSGQCGGRLAEAFFKLGYEKAIVINTTDKDVVTANAKHVILSLPDQPGGAGKNMALSRAALDRNRPMLQKTISDIFGKLDHILVCAGLGGGTGCGTVLQLIQIAQTHMKSLGYADYEKRVGAIVTLPTISETNAVVSKNVSDVANGLSDMADAGHISPLIVVDNEQVRRRLAGTPILKFWKVANNAIAQLVDSLNMISDHASEISTFDGADFASVMRGGGHMVLGAFRITDNKETIVEKLSDDSRSLLATGFDLKEARVAAAVVMVNEEAAEDDTELSNRIEEGFDALSQMLPNALLHRGIYPDKKPSTRVFLAYTGLKRPARYGDFA